MTCFNFQVNHHCQCHAMSAMMRKWSGKWGNSTMHSEFTVKLHCCTVALLQSQAAGAAQTWRSLKQFASYLAGGLTVVWRAYSQHLQTEQVHPYQAIKWDSDSRPLRVRECHRSDRKWKRDTLAAAVAKNFLTILCDFSLGASIPLIYLQILKTLPIPLTIPLNSLINL